jgi:hypothetical protein
MARQTPEERQHRALLAPVVDGLMRADEETRLDALARINETAVPPNLWTLRELLADQARRSRREEVRRGALQCLMGFGFGGVLRVCQLALLARSAPLRQEAADALRRYGRPLPGRWAEVCDVLQETAGGAGDPGASAARAALLGCLLWEESAADHDHEGSSAIPTGNAESASAPPPVLPRRPPPDGR